MKDKYVIRFEHDYNYCYTWIYNGDPYTEPNFYYKDLKSLKKHAALYKCPNYPFETGLITIED